VSAATVEAAAAGATAAAARTGLVPEQALDLSIAIISFNTREMLRECLQSTLERTAQLRCEIVVLDNASRDGSAEMVEQSFPQVKLLRSDVNLGFGQANNVALEQARGRYFVLLNSDAFLSEGALERAMEHMEQRPRCAMGGALLVSRDGALQPSARMFHSVWRDAVVLTGLAAKFPRSKFFGGFDRTWADVREAAAVDWVPGAFAILRPEAVRQVGLFDPAFFLYYEEVDLCQRLKKAGYEVWYWPDVVVTHVGGESSRQLKSLEFSGPAAQVVLWRMRSAMLYYRKHQGWKVRLAVWMERCLYAAAVGRNRWSRSAVRQQRAQHFRTLLKLLRQAWKETEGGRVSPPRPW
jgi:GT2 family glycosyltransferase